MTSPDDTDKTPAATPAAKRSSGSHRFTDVDCPACENDRAAFCDVCGCSRRVSLSVATNWILTHSSVPPPPTERR